MKYATQPIDYNLFFEELPSAKWVGVLYSPKTLAEHNYDMLEDFSRLLYYNTLTYVQMALERLAAINGFKRLLLPYVFLILPLLFN